MHFTSPVRVAADHAATILHMIGDELFPVAVWMAVFGATRLVPSLVLQLSMSVPQSMDVPELLLWRRRREGCPTSGTAVDSIHVAADAAAEQLAQLIRDTPLGSGGDHFASTLPPSWYNARNRMMEILVSLRLFPQRLLAYALFHNHQRMALSRSGDAGSSAWVHPWMRAMTALLHRLVTSFTSIWVHANGHMLFDTLVTYLNTRLGGGRDRGTFNLNGGGDQQQSGRAVWRRGGGGLRAGWRGLLVAACVSTGVNFIAQTFWIESLTSAGVLRARSLLPSSPPSSERGHTEPTLRVGSERAWLLLSALSRWSSKENMYRLWRMLLPFPREEFTPLDGAGGMPFFPLPSSSPSTREGLLLSSPPLPTPSTPTPRAVPPAIKGARVGLCGGNSFVFALCGFRCGLYGDAHQLFAAVSNYMTDLLEMALRQVRQQMAARQGLTAQVLQESESVWRPSEPLLASNFSVVLSPAASLQLLHLYVANFALGAGVGLFWRERRCLLAFARKVPVVSDAVAMLFPLPPPPLQLPGALQELSPEYHVLLVCPDGRVEAVGGADGDDDAYVPPLRKPTLTRTETLAASSSVPRAVRVVASQNLFCPIQRTLMTDPVQTEDGFTYDRDGIEEWLRLHDTAPLTNLPLVSTRLLVNWQARQQLADLVAAYTAALATVRRAAV